MRLPPPRGPITAALFRRLQSPPEATGPDAAWPDATGLHTAKPDTAGLDTPHTAKPDAARLHPAGPAAGLEDDDIQLALFACYEIHYQGFEGVDDRWEWDPGLLGFRAALEAGFERSLAAAVPRPEDPGPAGVRAALAALTCMDEEPLLPLFLQREASLENFREFVIHRSIFHQKGADPHTWAIPRLSGGPKAALVEIQSGEYGGGRRERMHSELFRATMLGLGLDDAYGAYLHRVPGVTLAIANLMSLFGLHRRWRGALLGHLAALEMTSSWPSRCYAAGLRRLGAGPWTAGFYDEHVVADSVHERLVANDMCGAFANAFPAYTGDILYGAACAMELEQRWAEHVMGCWQRGTGSLRAEPVPA